MKYYAVTDDPNELLHYGVKGMKWGKHLFGDDSRPKSAGYKRALGKLKGFAKKAKSSVQKSATQHAMNKQKKQEDKYNKAVQKSQQRINAIENMRNLHSLTNYEKQSEKAYNRSLKESRIIAKSNKYAEKAQMRADKLALKNSRKFARNESKMNKYMQEAREGRLHYGKLSEDQVRKITDRLALERSARSLGNTEKPSYRLRRKEAIREGKLEGYRRGTAAAMEEVARAGAIYGIKNFMNRKKLNAQAKQQGKQERIKAKEKNNKSNKEIRDEVKQEAYEAQIRNGTGFFNRTVGRHMTAKTAADIIQKAENDRLEADRTRKLQARLQDEIDTQNNESYQKAIAQKSERERVRKLNETINNELDMDRNEKYQALLKRQEENRFLTDEAHNSARNARQNRENEERAERQREIEAELAYKYNLFPGSSNGKSNNQNNQNNQNNGNKKKNGNGQGPKFDNIDQAKEYYRRRYIEGKTIQDEEAERKAKQAEISAKRAETIRRNKENERLRKQNEELRRKADAWLEEQRKKNDGLLNITPAAETVRFTPPKQDSTTVSGRKRRPKG